MMKIDVAPYLDEKELEFLKAYTEARGLNLSSAASELVGWCLKDRPNQEDWETIFPGKTYSVLIKLRDFEGAATLSKLPTGVIMGDLEWLEEHELINLEDREVSLRVSGRKIARVIDEVP